MHGPGPVLAEQRALLRCLALIVDRKSDAVGGGEQNVSGVLTPHEAGELLLARRAVKVNFLLRLIIMHVVAQLKQIALVRDKMWASLGNWEWNHLRDAVHKR